MQPWEPHPQDSFYLIPVVRFMSLYIWGNAPSTPAEQLEIKYSTTVIIKQFFHSFKVQLTLCCSSTWQGYPLSMWIRRVWLFLFLDHASFQLFSCHLILSSRRWIGRVFVKNKWVELNFKMIKSIHFKAGSIMAKYDF